MKISGTLNKCAMVILFIAIFFSFSCDNTIFATNVPVFSVDEVSAVVGETVNVNINVANNPGFNALKLKLTYDSTVLKLKSSKPIDVADKMSFTTSQSNDVSPFVMVWTSASNVTGNGKIATLTFDVLKSSKDLVTSLELECDFCSDQGGNNISSKLMPGSIKVTKNNNSLNSKETLPPTDFSVLDSEESNKILYWWVFIVIPIPVIITAIIMIVMLIKRKR